MCRLILNPLSQSSEHEGGVVVILRVLLSMAVIVLTYQALKFAFRRMGWWESENFKGYAGLLSLVAMVGVNYIAATYGTKVPGAFLERDDYEVMLYVRLYPDMNEVKSYWVPAKIESVTESYCEPAVDMGERCESLQVYYIRYAVMPNGGTIVFDEEGTVRLNEKEYVFDEQGRYWGVEMTNEVVE